MNKLKRKTALGVAVALLGTTAAQADFEGEANDAWLTGKIETVFLLNGNLNNFKIDTDVENGIAHLTGTVESDIDRDLAVQLAKGVDGIVEINDDIMVDANAAHVADEPDADGESRSFGTWVDDATTTAAVKSKLVGNSNVAGLQIDVDTRGDVVTLSGRVDSDEQRSLAEQLARNTGDVGDVKNNLVVDAQ